jgi:hypothetical protein
MDKNWKLVIYIITIIVNYGVPELIRLLNQWATKDPTLEDIEALKSIPIDPNL